MKQKPFGKIIPSPVGNLLLLASENALIEIVFLKFKNKYFTKKFIENPQNPLLIKIQRQLKEYFAGNRKNFDIPFFVSGTDFQIRVWNELQKIPFGKTISYQELAGRVKNKKYARAVGNANGKNPIPIIIPCHRVISKNGNLGGFGGGIEIKKYLLEMERKSV